jgi:hypothetical protein
MANLTETAQWHDNIYQIATGDKVKGGVDGVANKQPQQLADRTQYLKQKVEGGGGAARLQNSMGKFGYAPQDAVVRGQGNINITTGGIVSIDGIQLKAGDIVLLTEQTDKKTNGLYTVQSGPWARVQGYTATDGQAFDYNYIVVASGNADGGKIYAISTEQYTIGQTDLEFVETAFSIAPLPGKIVIRDRTGNLPNVELLDDIVVRKNKKILGTKVNGSQALIAEYAIYNEGELDQTEQVEIGSETEHLNLNTDENGESGNHVTVDTKDPVTHAPVKKVLAYLDDLAGGLAGALPLSGGAMTGTLANAAAAQVRNIRYGTTDLTAGTSALTTGEVYFVYE